MKTCANGDNVGGRQVSMCIGRVNLQDYITGVQYYREKKKSLLLSS